MQLAVGQPIVAAAGFQPAGRLERRLRAGLPAPQNRQNFGRRPLAPDRSKWKDPARSAPRRARYSHPWV